MFASRRAVGRGRAGGPGGRMSVARLEIRRNDREADHQSDGRSAVLRGGDQGGRHLRRSKLTRGLADDWRALPSFISPSAVARKIPNTKFAIFSVFRV